MKDQITTLPTDLQQIEGPKALNIIIDTWKQEARKVQSKIIIRK